MPTVLGQMTTLLREFTGDPSLVIERDMPLRGTLGLDSYDLASLLGAAEERFNVAIADRAALDMFTVGDVVDYLIEYTQG